MTHLNNSVAVDLRAHLNVRLRSGTGTCCLRAVTEPYPTLEQVESSSKKIQGDDYGESWWFGRWRVEGIEIEFSSPSRAANFWCANPGTFWLGTKMCAQYNCAHNPIVLYLVKYL